MRFLAVALLTMLAIGASGGVLVFGSELFGPYQAARQAAWIPTLYSLALALLSAMSASNWLSGHWRRAVVTSLLVVFLAVVLPVGLFVALDLLIGRQ